MQSLAKGTRQQDAKKKDEKSQCRGQRTDSRSENDPGSVSQESNGVPRGKNRGQREKKDRGKTQACSWSQSAPVKGDERFRISPPLHQHHVGHDTEAAKQYEAKEREKCPTQGSGYFKP